MRLEAAVVRLRPAGKRGRPHQREKYSHVPILKYYVRLIEHLLITQVLLELEILLIDSSVGNNRSLSRDLLFQKPLDVLPPKEYMARSLRLQSLFDFHLHVKSQR